MMATRIIIGLAMTMVALAIAGRRLVWLFRLIQTGQPSPGRLDGVGQLVRTELIEVFGQRKLLKWSIPGLAHFFTFWGFIILAATILESYGALFVRDFAIPLIGHSPVLGFLEDFFAVAVLAAVITFSILRVRQAPERRQRDSRFYGSHTAAAWVILGMIAAVVITLLLYRAAQVNTGYFPYESGAFASEWLATVLEPLGETANDVIETVFILAQIGVILGFVVLVAYSKHLHILLAPINVATKRRPDGLGPLLPVESGGKPVDFEDPGEDDLFGVGKVEDFKWKAMLDFATCTECGRCQSQCPAWNTGKPLSPKLVIMDLRDHLFAKAPYLLDAESAGKRGDGAPQAVTLPGPEHHGVPESGFGRVPGFGPEQAGRPLVGTLAEGGVIDPDVLWSCTTCGACVEECPVDIEHVDHIVDMRRHQVLVQSEFPAELSGLFKNLEKAGNPWGMPATARLDWATDLPFELKVVGSNVNDLSQVEWLFWVGCAGAFEERAKKTTRAVAELLHIAGVEFAVLAGETCTGDPARRAGNEFLFHMLASENVETLREARAIKVVASCAHCFNTIKNEYRQYGVSFEVLHHTQLLNRLVREGRLKPVAPAAGQNGARPITYHDPCYIGRHNKVYEPPRELLGALPDVELREMPRNSDRSFCCGAGGARMWMEERIGTRVNNERTREALETGAERIATGCPYCKVMLGDAVITAQSEGRASDVEVLDVAQMLLAAVRRDESD